jgi:hypothetical protein
MEGRDSYRILVLFSYSYYKYGHNWAPKYERLLESGMVISCTIFQLHIFKRQIYANILDASAFPTPRTTGPLTRTKTMFYRLKAIDANKKPTTNLQFSWLRNYLQTGWQCGDQKSRVVCSQKMEPKDLVANSILYMLMRQQFQRLCSVFEQ